VPAPATSTPTATLSTCTPSRVVSWVTYVCSVLLCSVLFCYVRAGTYRMSHPCSTSGSCMQALYTHELPVRWLVITLCQALQPRRRAKPSVPAAATSTTKATLSTCTPSRVVSCTTVSSLYGGLTMSQSVCRCDNHLRVIHGDAGAREQTNGRGGRGETHAAGTQPREKRESTNGCQGKTRYQHTTIPPYHHCVA
jgi:hypothetical protein